MLFHCPLTSIVSTEKLVIVNYYSTLTKLHISLAALQAFFYV
jgi:hypothetical protein